MKIKKIRIDKKGLSEMISYVILIAIAIGLSIGVYVWLKDFANVSPAIDCKDGTSLILKEDPQTTPTMVTINVENNGYFNINGLIMHVGNDTKKMPIKKLVAMSAGYIIAGYYDFDPELKPGESRTIIFLNEQDYNITVVQIQPYIRDDKGKIIVCEKAVIKQEVG